MAQTDKLFNHPYLNAERKKICDKIEEKYRKKEVKKKEINNEEFKKWLNTGKDT